MNFDEYDRRYRVAYGELANVVKLLLEKAIGATAGVPAPQSIQSRAKAAASLKAKLKHRELLTSDAIEQEIRDLAGVRLIFYTNTDVNRFLESRVIPENFQVHWDATRVHHPTDENARLRYQAIHYTVFLNPQRLALPEYVAFSGMRCEIQIQTILNHAWAESSHDILYKPATGAGFGTKAMQSIDQRMKRIMDDFLLPAGYELQKVQHDFERLIQGKALFDRGIIESLQSCTNNNDRHDVLSSIQEYVLPNYDDINAIYPELRREALRAFDESRQTATTEVTTPFGNLPGKTKQDITAIVTDILERLRYVDVDGTFRALLHLYSREQDARQREHIVRVVKELSEYNLHVWQKAGPGAQMVLTDSIDRLDSTERMQCRALLLTAWREMLSPDLKGTSFGAETVTLRRGAITVIDEVREIRRKAIEGTFNLLDAVTSENDKMHSINTVRAATHLPSQATYSNELCSLVLADTRHIAEQMTQRISDLPYQVLAHVENYLLFDYERARDIATAERDRFGCQKQAQELMPMLRSFHDAVDTDIHFVRYKTLVGLSSVFQQQWDDGSIDYVQVDQYRKAKIVEFVRSISQENEEEWFYLIEQCAATKSADLATFPIFADFIVALARDKPQVARKLLDSASGDLLTFLPAFLGGLAQSGAPGIYQEVIAGHLAKGTYLAGLARHWRLAQPERPTFIDAVLDKAIAAHDDAAVIECVAASVVSHGTESQLPVDAFFGRAMRHLTQRANYRWIREVWYLPQAEAFYSGLPAKAVRIVLDSLLPAPKLGYETERILSCIARTHTDLVWAFLAQRLSAPKERERDPSYDAIPYEFRDLTAPLSTDPALAIGVVRGLYRHGDHLFEFGGARLLSQVFPTCPEPFAAQLTQLVAAGSDDDIGFVLKVLRSYRGSSAIHSVVRQLVARLPEEDARLPEVEICLETTGLVSGQFGFVEAFRAKKVDITAWLDDEHPKVKAFAARFIARLDTRIASEQRSAEERLELRKREYDTDTDA
jgi:ppGpp synthetase/RelA/SpoT-type nucleotidyltranferase